MLSWKWKFRKVQIKKAVKEWWQQRSLLKMTFLANKFRSPCRAIATKKRKRGKEIKQCYVCHTSISRLVPDVISFFSCAFILPDLLKNPHTCPLLLYVFNKRSGHFLLLQSKSSPSSAPHYVLIPWSRPCWMLWWWTESVLSNCWLTTAWLWAASWLCIAWRSSITRLL